jgi:hypothetical protein
MSRLLAISVLLAAAPRQEKSHKIPSVDLKQRVIWGSVCELPDGSGLAFGGQDQHADDSNPHTRVKEAGEWKAIHEELRAANPGQRSSDKLRARALEMKALASRMRALHFRGLGPSEEVERLRLELAREGKGEPEGRRQALETAQARAALLEIKGQLSAADLYVALHAEQLRLESVTDSCGFEPPPRALSPIAYDEKMKVFVLFGGDHLDYLTNDTWTFDPAARKWTLRSPQGAPPPRANHALSVADGKVVVKGGYTYTSATGYVSSQYRELADGEWTYDLEKNEWTGAGKLEPPDTRVYRTGPYDPDFYLEGEKPDAKAVAAKLAALPENEWVAMNPPKLPRLNRDWGTAILDPDRDLILRWSGGHSAHGGTDVLHYHLSTNRWELPFPVEFPLGQLYSNTSYPEGMSFNGRPWVTGHTYQNYGYDPVAKRMVFAGRHAHSYFYDPARADWTGRAPKPPGMVYNDCFYTLTLAPTPAALTCWTQNGKLFRHEKDGWTELALAGPKLPGAVVDNSTVVHDAKRDRLLFWRKGYGDKNVYDGEIHAVDLKSLQVSALGPAGREGASEVPYLCQIRYDASNDLLLVGGTLPPGDDGFRRTPAYDPEKNRWVSLRVGGQDPSGKKGRNVSLGMMYDAKRKLFWAVDTDSRVFVLRLVPATADLRPLR